jgi:hypothetical protein
VRDWSSDVCSSDLADSKPDVIQLTSWWLEIRDQLAFPKHGFMWKCP